MKKHKSLLKIQELGKKWLHIPGEGGKARMMTWSLGQAPVGRDNNQEKIYLNTNYPPQMVNFS